MSGLVRAGSVASQDSTPQITPLALEQPGPRAQSVQPDGQRTALPFLLTGAVVHMDRISTSGSRGLLRVAVWAVSACVAGLAGPPTAAAAVVAGDASSSSEAPGYQVLVLRDVMIPMRDGVRLATDIYLPSRDGRQVAGRFPAVVSRTPYNKDFTWARPEEYWIRRGYVVVSQDVRGRYKSEGRWRMLVDDGRDGYDLLKWIGEQPWSNGKVGTVGASYVGATQHALALANAPNLAAMVPIDAVSNTGRFGIRHQGAFELRWLNWIFALGGVGGDEDVMAPARAAQPPAAAPSLAELRNHVREYLGVLPLRAGTTPLKFAPDYEQWLIEAMSHGDNDAFWTDMGSSVVDHITEYQDIPVYHVTGWYDSWSGPVADLSFPALARAKGAQRLIIGPWTHYGQEQSYAGIAEFGPTATIDRNDFERAWFDHWLKGIANGVDKAAPIRLFVMGGGDGHRTAEGRVFVGGHWRDEQEWPLARAVNTAYYLHADGSLSTDAPSSSPPTRYSFDPRHPVPTVGGNISSFGSVVSVGAQDQRCTRESWPCSDTLPLSARTDVLVFQTPPLERDVEVTGPLVVKLWAGSNAPDTDFTAKLIDVHPPSRDFPSGVEINIADGIVRARYRDSLTRAKPMRPGEAYEFSIELYPTALVFQRGHRIRVDVSSSNFPRFDVNPNTGEPLNGQRRWRVAENLIYHDAGHPSRIILPIVPPAPR